MMCVALTRSIGGIVIDVVIEEKHVSEMTIPEHPVERGAKISDHAWRAPFLVTVTGAVAGSAALAALEAFHGLQEQAEPFDFMSPLKLYRSMLVKRIEVTRDVEKARILFFEADLQEVIIVSTETEAGTGEAADGKAGDKNGVKAAGDKAQGTTKRGQIQPKPLQSETLLGGGLRAN